MLRKAQAAFRCSNAPMLHYREVLPDEEWACALLDAAAGGAAGAAGAGCDTIAGAGCTYAGGVWTGMTGA